MKVKQILQVGIGHASIDGYDSPDMGQYAIVQIYRYLNYTKMSVKI